MQHGISSSAQGAKRPLGTYAKSATPPQNDAGDSSRAVIRACRAERYGLLAEARNLFLIEGKKAQLEHAFDWHRTAKCKHITHGGAVGVHTSNDHSGAFYSGLINCGSVWACPVCAAKVQERRREEIAQAVNWAHMKGLQPVMVTLTFPHYSWQDLRTLIDQQADALRRLRAGAPWRRFKEAHGYQGLIRSLELTHGANGWHPHTHELWFVDKAVNADLMRDLVLERWRSCCIRAGLLNPDDPQQVAAFNAHAVDVRGNCSASDYLAKQDDSRNWGVDRELAKASSKAGRRKGVHPFGLLSQSAEGSTKAGELFVEYAKAMKGKRQLFWSRGLKEQVGIGEMSDEELVEDERDSADLLGRLTRDEWRAVRYNKQQAPLLDAAELGGWVAVQKLVSGLQKPPKRAAKTSFFDTAEAEPVASKSYLEAVWLGDSLHLIDCSTGELAQFGVVGRPGSGFVHQVQTE